MFCQTVRWLENKEQYQITIGFNIPFSDRNEKKIIKAYFVYNNSNIDIVLADALKLSEDIKNLTLDLSHLRCEKVVPIYAKKIPSELNFLKPGNVFQKNGETFMVHGQGVIIHKIAADKSLWLKDN